MTHPGMPLAWALFVWAGILLIGIWGLVSKQNGIMTALRWRLDKVPVLGQFIHFAATTPWILLALRLLTVSLFLLVIIAGLLGSPVPGRNLATVLTWNLWWAGLIMLIFFLGSSWCSICPWDTLASWLVKRRLWKRADDDSSLNLPVPSWLRNVWPALLMFVGLTWLELGVGITLDPYATAILALLMLVLATLSLATFKRKAFCRHFCPVGRTIGFYAQLAPVELRPIDTKTCDQCETLECYYGNDTIEPCPTNLVMGTLTQNTYCLSCGNCTQSCPEENIAWRLRSPSTEAMQEARPHWDEAWFMLVLLTLTSFHGITMMSFWENAISRFAWYIGETGQLLWSFTLGLFISIAVPVMIYDTAIALVQKISSQKNAIPFKQRFIEMAFVAIPLAFFYHIAHNLNHLLRENSDILKMISDPLGRHDTTPLSLSEQAELYNALSKQQGSLFDTSVCISTQDGSLHEMLISQGSLFTLQALLLVAGFYIAIRIIRSRGNDLIEFGNTLSAWRLLPLFLFAAGVTVAHLWLLMQPMVMRM